MLRQRPWPHLVVDNFLPADVLGPAHAEIASESYSFDIEARGTGRIEYSLLKSETLWRAIYSKQVMGLLSDAFDVRLTLNRDNLLQLRRMNDATPEFPVHSDFTAGIESVVSFLYLSPGWREEYGGRLHLYFSKEDSSPAVSVEPVENRLVVFSTAASHWHSVEKVCGWERRSILAMWDIVEPS